MTRTRGAWAAFAALSGFFWLATRYLSEVTDDAFISFRYARHLVEGSGLVFNGGERVEGYTNFLWTLLMAGGYALGAELPWLSQVLGCLAAAGLVVAVALFSQRHFAGAPFPALSYLAAALLATSPLFIHHTGNGLETVLFALLTFASVASYAERGTRFGHPAVTGALVGLAWLVRPDAMLWLAVFVAVDAAGFLRSGRIRAADVRRVALYAGIPAAVVAVHVLWRLHYYGDWLPNTFYVKVGSNWQWGAVNLMLFGPAMGVLTLVSVVAGPLLLRARWATCAALIVAADLLFLLRNGGAGGRYAVALLPLVYLLLQETVRFALAQVSLRRPARVAPAAATIGAAVLALALSAGVHEWQRARSSVAFSRITTVQNRRLARCLVPRTRPDDAIAVISAGVFPYYAERPIIDMLGLNDRHIARHGHTDRTSGTGHQRHDSDYVLERSPRVVLISDRWTGSVAAVRELLESPEFRRRFEPVELACKGSRHRVFVDRDRPLPDTSSAQPPAPAAPAGGHRDEDGPALEPAPAQPSTSRDRGPSRR